jgi:hypothetical protein
MDVSAISVNGSCFRVVQLVCLAPPVFLLSFAMPSPTIDPPKRFSNIHITISQLPETRNTNTSDSNENTPRDTNDNIPHNTLDRDEALIRASDVNELKQWAEGFKINKPIPIDLLPILAKNDAKQMEIVMKNVSLRGRRNGGGA